MFTVYLAYTVELRPDTVEEWGEEWLNTITSTFGVGLLKTLWEADLNLWSAGRQRDRFLYHR